MSIRFRQKRQFSRYMPLQPEPYRAFLAGSGPRAVTRAIRRHNHTNPGRASADSPRRAISAQRASWRSIFARTPHGGQCPTHQKELPPIMSVIANKVVSSSQMERYLIHPSKADKIVNSVDLLQEPDHPVDYPPDIITHR